MRPRRPWKATVRSGPIAAKSWSPTNASAYSAPGITAYFGSPAPTNGSSPTTLLPDAMRPRGVDRYTGERIRTGNKREIRFARLEFDERGGWRAAHQTGDGIDEQPGVVMNSGDMRGGEHVIGWQRCREDDKTVADMR